MNGCKHDTIDIKTVGKEFINAVCGVCGKTIQLSAIEFVKYKFKVATPNNDGVWIKPKQKEFVFR